VTEPQRIFISYRREQTAAHAGRIFDRLTAAFGEQAVFMDVDSIGVGMDFTRALEDAVSSCAVMLVLIGPGWAEIAGRQGGRLDDPDDYVRQEIEAGLARDIRVIPVLLSGAVLPRPEELPEGLRPLVRRQTFSLPDEAFGSLVHVLVERLSPMVAPGRAETGRGERTAEGGYDWSSGGRQVVEVEHRRRGLFGLLEDRRISCIAFSADGKRIATAGEDMTARVWEIATGNELIVLTHDNSVSAVAFSPDGARIATANGNTVRIWDAHTGGAQSRLTHVNLVWGIAWRPDGKRIASASQDKSARVFEVDGARELMRVSHDAVAWGAAFSPDGKRIATASSDNTARVWEADTGNEVSGVTHRGVVRSVAFSPDGKRIVTASEDRTARAWEVDSGDEVTQLTHPKGVLAAAFSPEGRWIATAAWDSAARVWDADSGREVTRLNHDNVVRAAAFSPDGRRIATASDDKTARVWEPAEVS
jgi:TIR domain/WD domain, G-beta repeat